MPPTAQYLDKKLDSIRENIGLAYMLGCIEEKRDFKHAFTLFKKSEWELESLENEIRNSDSDNSMKLDIWPYLGHIENLRRAVQDFGDATWKDYHTKSLGAINAT